MQTGQKLIATSHHYSDADICIYIYILYPTVGPTMCQVTSLQPLMFSPQSSTTSTVYIDVYSIACHVSQPIIILPIVSWSINQYTAISLLLGMCFRPSSEAAIAAQEVQGPAQGRTVQCYGADVVVHFGARHPWRLTRL